MLLWVAAPALAEPSAARQCADAAEGTEAEICLQLAARHPDELDAIAAALRARIDRRSASDRDLLQALLLLLDDETGVQGARLLGEVGDPRALGALEHAAEHREVAVAVAAVGSLARYEQGLEPLSRYLLDRELALDVRVAAAQAIGELGSDEGGDVLLQALRRRRVPAPLRQEMIRTVQQRFPDRRDELDRPVGTDGAPWLAIGSGFGLGYTLGAAGHFGRQALAGPGAVAGGVAGATAGWLGGRAFPIEAGDAAFISSNGIGGTAAGVLLGDGLTGDPDYAWVGGLGGEAVGFALGNALYDRHPGSGGDGAETLIVAGLAGIGAGLGADAFVAGEPDGRLRAPSLAAGVGVAGGLVAGQIVAPRVTLAGTDAALVTLTTLAGAAAGTLAPVADDERVGLAVAGAAVGGLVGYGLAGPLDAPGDVLFGAAAGMGFGAALGAGAGVAAFPDADATMARRGLTLAGATGGLLAGATVAAADRDPIEGTDGVVVALATGWAAWQTAGWLEVADPGVAVPTGREAGLYVLVPAAAGAGAAVLSPWLDVPVSHSLAGASLGLWGGYVAVVGADLAARPVLPWALAGSNVGLVVGAVAMSPVLNTPPLVIGLADAGGVLGGATFALASSYFTDDVSVIVGASMVGAGMGFAGGALYGQSLQGTTRDVAVAPRLPVRLALAPAALPGDDGVAYGVVVRGHGW